MNNGLPVGFGVGIVNRFTRNRKLHAFDTLMGIASSIKHFKISPSLIYRYRAHNIVEFAFQKGIKIFDTARIYGYSEYELGLVIEKHNRNDLFICTKVSDMDLYREGGAKSVKENLLNSLKDLRTDYVDLYLLHWPSGNWIEIYKQMNDIYEEGLIRHIGVCNCSVNDLQMIKMQTDLKMPEYCQLECHPFCQNLDIINYCKEHSITVLAHTPTARMTNELLNNSVLKEIARKYNKTISQIVLKWHIQNNRIPITHTKNKKHLNDNINIFDFNLSEDDIILINQLDQNRSFFKTVGIDNPNYIYNK